MLFVIQQILYGVVDVYLVEVIYQQFKHDIFDRQIRYQQDVLLVQFKNLENVSKFEELLEAKRLLKILVPLEFFFLFLLVSTLRFFIALRAYLNDNVFRN